MWSVRKYGPVFVESDRLAEQINHLLRPDESFYEWGDETGLYFATKRQPPSGVFFAEPLIFGPLRGRLWQRFIADLDRTRPDLFIVEYQFFKKTQSAHPIRVLMKENYSGFATSTRFLLLARKGSRLQRQMAAEYADRSPISSGR